MSDRVRARLAELRSELDTLDGSLPPDGPSMTDPQITELARRMTSMEATLAELAREIRATGTTMTEIQTQHRYTERDAAAALAAASALSESVRAVQGRAESAEREACASRESARATAAKQDALDARLRDVETAERDRITQRRTLAAVTSVGGTAGLGSALWHLAVSLGWMAG